MGGADGTVTDLAAALEQVTAALIPGPVMPTLLAGLLLAGGPAPLAVRPRRLPAEPPIPAPATPPGSALLPELAAGQATAAVALSSRDAPRQLAGRTGRSG